MKQIQPRLIMPLTAFQRDWILDHSRFKLAVKSRRIGFTYAATLEIVLDALEHKTHWMIVSRTQDASREALTECRNHLERMNRLRRAKIIDERSGILLDGIEQSKFTIALPNGSRIVAMTAHPDATRGFGGHILLTSTRFIAIRKSCGKAWSGRCYAAIACW